MGVKDSDSTIHFFLYLTMLNLSSLKKKHEIGYHDYLPISGMSSNVHVPALVLFNPQVLSSLYGDQIRVHCVRCHFAETYFGP